MSKRQKWMGIILLTPFLLHTAVFSVYSAASTAVLSFKEDYSLLSKEYSGWGLKNYVDVIQDVYFRQSIVNTTIYSAIVVPTTLIIGVFLAVLLNKKLKGTALFQTAFFLPLITSSAAVSYSMRLIFNSQYGILNSLLQRIGFPSFAWLVSPKYSMSVLVICGIWGLLPFTILTVLSTLQNIDQRYYLAAEIDGASPIKVFRGITFPAISHNILLLAVLHTISSFRVFSELFYLFSGRPGPSYNLYTLVYYMFEQMQSFSTGAYGRAAAVACILFIILLGLSIVSYMMRFTKASRNDNSRNTDQ